MLTTLCWLWNQPGGRSSYTARHVNIWAAMVRRHLSMPHRLACVTDMPDGIDASVDIISPPREFEDWRIPSWGDARPQCLRRIAMFGPRAAEIFGSRFVCMDLDCVVSGELDPLFEGNDDFRIYRGTAKGRIYNGSMMLIRAGARPQVYDRFTLQGAVEAGKRFIGSDQAWISHVLGPGEKTWGPEHGVHWWQGQPAKNARLVFFPGGLKPWGRIEDPFIGRHYRGSGAGRCLILGYSPTVWDEAESMLSRGAFDAVIASPEAARHWPGDVLAVAKDDTEAERIATMHGFDEVIFCGRSKRQAA